VSESGRACQEELQYHIPTATKGRAQLCWVSSHCMCMSPRTHVPTIILGTVHTQNTAWTFMYSYVCIHIHKHTHTCTHKCRDAWSEVHTPPPILSCTPTQISTVLYALLHIHRQTSICEHVDICITTVPSLGIAMFPISMRTDTRTFTGKHVSSCPPIHRHQCTHPHIHTHRCAHT
jgi:hypothetical protein